MDMQGLIRVCFLLLLARFEASAFSFHQPTTTTEQTTTMRRRVAKRQGVAFALSSSQSSSSTGVTPLANSTTSTSTTSPTKDWFPTRIQETVSYREIVQRLYVRQIVTETKDLADWVVQQVYGDANKANEAHGDTNEAQADI